MPEPRFFGPLRIQDEGGRHWIVLEPLRFYSQTHRGTFVVPAGFVTDLASIPRGLWNLFPKTGAYDRAAVLHDAAYAGALRTPSGKRVRLIKPFADRLFHEAMRADGVGRVQAQLMYVAVKTFGRMHDGAPTGAQQ